jgi:hypothetical protein
VAQVAKARAEENTILLDCRAIPSVA